MPFAEINGAKLFYTDVGAGDPVMLFIHGWTCDSHDWSWSLPHFGDRRVIAADLRGHGQSSVPDQGYTTRQFASDLIGLLDHLGIQSAVVIGHSMGGAIATAMAVEHPGRVAACVNIDPAFGMPPAFAPFVGSAPMGLAGDDGPQRLGAAMAAMSNPQTPLHLVTWHTRRAMASSMPAARQCIDNLFHGADAWGLRPASDEYLAGRTCPSLAFYPDHGRSECEAIALRGPHDKLIVWEGSGHWLHQERPEEFNAVLRAWTADLP